MRISKAIESMVFLVEHSFPFLLAGAPGVGKSDSAQQVAEYLNIDFMVTHPIVDEPTDYKGQPWVIDGKAVFLPFPNLERLLTAKRKLLCFIDDLGQASEAVQKAIMQLLLSRTINGQKVSDFVVFGAATNRKQDRAGVTGILEPVKGRFVTIIDVEPNIDDWVQWALTKGNMPVDLVAFMRYRPNLLLVHNPSRDMVNSSNPRTIANAGRMINAGIPRGLETELISGAAGSAFAAELTGFLALKKNLPNIDQIVLTGGGKVPTEPAVFYALSAVLAEKMNAQNIDNISKYLTKLNNEEVFAATIKDATTRNPNLTDTAAYMKWATEYGNILFN